MLVARTAFGRSDLAVMAFTESPTYLDDGEAYDVKARSNRFPPAGIGGEAAFYLLYLALSHEALETPIRVQFYVDDIPMQPIDVILMSDGVTRKNTVLELSLLQPLADWPTYGKFAPRGCWFQVEILTDFELAAAFVQIDAAEVEIEVVREGKRQGANP